MNCGALWANPFPVLDTQGWKGDGHKTGVTKVLVRTGVQRWKRRAKSPKSLIISTCLSLEMKGSEEDHRL